MSKDFCVIEFGTNAVKCLPFKDGESVFMRNSAIEKKDNGDLDAENVVNSVINFFNEAKSQGIDPERVYICATQGMRRSSQETQDEITKRIKEAIGRNIHILSPRKEARLSALGGLGLIPEPEDKREKKDYTLFIESGGGSTEVSLFDMTGKNIAMIDTVSIELGSDYKKVEKKSEEDAQKEIKAKISRLIENLEVKGIDASKSLGIVINASVATDIMWRKCASDEEKEAWKNRDKEHPDPQFSKPLITTKKRYSLSSKDFEYNLQKILQSIEAGEDRFASFEGHTSILSNIFAELHRFYGNSFDRTKILTTCGGLKEGAKDEIMLTAEKPEDEIEKTVFIRETEDIDEDDLITKIHKLKLTSDDRQKLQIYKEYYNRQKITTEYNDKDQFKASDGNKSIKYNSMNDVTIKNDKDSTDNKLYEKMILLAKLGGKNSVTFDNNVSLDLKLRIYAACQKYDVALTNFTFEESMLKDVSKATQNIVLNKTATPKTPKTAEKTYCETPVR